MSLLSLEKMHDNYHTYYREKIWEMIPAYYRHEDGIAQNPDALRSIVEIVAQEVAQVRRSHDQLWQDQSIEYCQDWAVPYIGDLLATRLLSALNSRGQRIDVAKTIYYRRRKGTLGVLEELISDIAGWEGKVVESFKQLARARHGLDPALPENAYEPDSNKLLGLFTNTPQGGTADLRNTQGRDLVASAFDEYFYTPDFRQHNGKSGRYNIPKLAFHIYRLKACSISSADVFQLDNRRFSFDPSGRDTQLFSARNRAEDWHNWHSAEPWELPAPISCRLLNHAKFVITNRLLIELEDYLGVSTAAVAALGDLRGQVHSSQRKLQTLIGFLNQPELETPAVSQFIIKSALIEDCGKYQLFPAALAVYENGSIVEREETAAANLSNWPVADAGKRLLVDPVRGVMQFFGSVPQNLTVDFHYGTPTGLGAGAHDRSYIEAFEPTTELPEGAAIGAADLHNNGITQIADNKTHSFQGNKNQVESLAIQAANNNRPYLRMTANWILRALNPPAVEGEDARVRLDGLWFGSEGASRSIIFRGDGDFESVTISHCTLDPGGSLNINGDAIEPVSLIVEAKIEKLRIQNSVVGRIEVRNGGLIEEMEITDSVLDASNHAKLLGLPNPGNSSVISAPQSTVHIHRSTVFGSIQVNRLWASDTILVGQPLIADTQTGCFRFSAAPAGSKLPKPYESQVINDANSMFVSNEFGQPNYAQLSEQAPAEIQEGAENGAGMGVFNSLITPIKQKGLERKVNEYMPFGLIPLFINET